MASKNTEILWVRCSKEVKEWRMNGCREIKFRKQNYSLRQISQVENNMVHHKFLQISISPITLVFEHQFFSRPKAFFYFRIDIHRFLWRNWVWMNQLFLHRITKTWTSKIKTFKFGSFLFENLQMYFNCFEHCTKIFGRGERNTIEFHLIFRPENLFWGNFAELN